MSNEYLDRRKAIWADGHQKLVTFGVNSSGIDAGEIDFSIAVLRVSNLSPKDRIELIRVIRSATEIIEGYGHE